MGIDDHTIEHMKGRIEQCRRLAVFTNDENVSRVLLQMAEDAEADLRRLEAERASKATIRPDMPNPEA